MPAAGPSSLVHLRVFLSSPGDVTDERQKARDAIAELAREPFFAETKLEAVSWDDPHGSAPMVAHLDPQSALERHLPKPSECAVVVGIFRERMGTPLPEARYRKTDGAPYLSGTEYELTEAFAAGLVDVLLYRRVSPRRFSGSRPAPVDADQSRRLHEYLDRLAGERRFIRDYTSPARFQKQLKQDLRQVLARRLQEARGGAGEGPPPGAAFALVTPERVGALLTVIGALGAAVTAWSGLGDQSLDVRWGFVAVAILAVISGVVLTAAGTLRRLARAKRAWAAAGIGVIVAAASVACLEAVTTRPSLLVYHTSCRASVPGWRCVRFVPPPYPVSVDLRLAIRDRRTNPCAEWYPTRWTRGGDSQASMRDDCHQLTVRLERFRAPDVYGVAYRLAGDVAARQPDDLVSAEVVVRGPRDVLVLREPQLDRYRFWFLSSGGVLWGAVGLLLFFWSRPAAGSTGSHPAGTRTPAPS